MSRTPGNPSAPVNSAVWTTDNYAVDAGLSVDQDRRRDEFDKRMLRIGSRFERVEPRRRAALVRGSPTGQLLVDRSSTPGTPVRVECSGRGYRTDPGRPRHHHPRGSELGIRRSPDKKTSTVQSL
jgi:hypothetical protein